MHLNQSSRHRHRVSQVIDHRSREDSGLTILNTLFPTQIEATRSADTDGGGRAAASCAQRLRLPR